MSAYSHKRTLAFPKEVEHYSLTTLREKLIRIGAKILSHGRYVAFPMAEVAVSRRMFREILSLIARLRTLGGARLDDGNTPIRGTV